MRGGGGKALEREGSVDRWECLLYYVSLHYSVPTVFDESGNFLLYATMVGVKGEFVVLRDVCTCTHNTMLISPPPLPSSCIRWRGATGFLFSS